MAGAAISPACRMAPPSIFAAWRARAMKSLSPARIAPTGAPSPLHRANHTESRMLADLDDRHAEIRRGIEQARAVDMQRKAGLLRDAVDRRHVLERKRPSRPTRCACSRDRSASSPPAHDLSRGDDRGLHVVGIKHAIVAAHRPRHGARQAPTARRLPSCRYGPTPRRSPRRRGRRARSPLTRFAIVPDGRNSASSLPVSAAPSRSSSLTVGSSPRAESPRRAAFIAAIISAVGSVTVSLRKS